MSTSPAFRPVPNHPPRVEVERRADGAVVLRNPYPMLAPPANLIAPFRRWAAEAPERIWLAERTGPGPGWRMVSYHEANETVARIAEGLIARGLGKASADRRPLMILSGNSVDHALITYGAILAGCPVAPVSRAYSTMSSDFAKLRFVVDLVKPAAIYADDMPVYDAALDALNLDGIQLFHSKRPSERHATTPILDLMREPSGAVAENAFDALTFDTVAKYMFTSGSTGWPKAAINTHRMMCTNAAMTRSMLRDSENEPPAVTLSWLPWSHTFGANSVLNNNTTSWGGTLYIDFGSPTAAGFAETLRNLGEVSLTTYSNVPAAFAMLAPALERDAALAETFFKDLKLLSYGGAAMSQDIYDRIQAVAIRTVGAKIPFGNGYGATETAPVVSNVHWATDRMGLIGLPLPGVTMKLVPVGAKMEVRAKGDCITPGYHGRPDLTEAAFDEEGFYKLGDAAKLADPEDPSKGLVFDGRVVEDFKLDTGTFVNAGRLRIQAIEAGQGLIQDALVAGQDRAYVSVLAWPNAAGVKALTGRDLSPEEIQRDPAVRAAIAEGLKRHNAANPGSSTQIRRLAFMTEPPSLDAGEITDKGSINQALSLGRRRTLVEALYADVPADNVVVT